MNTRLFLTRWFVLTIVSLASLAFGMSVIGILITACDWVSVTYGTGYAVLVVSALIVWGLCGVAAFGATIDEKKL